MPHIRIAWTVTAFGIQHLWRLRIQTSCLRALAWNLSSRGQMSHRTHLVSFTHWIYGVCSCLTFSSAGSQPMLVSSLKESYPVFSSTVSAFQAYGHCLSSGMRAREADVKRHEAQNDATQRFQVPTYQIPIGTKVLM